MCWPVPGVLVGQGTHHPALWPSQSCCLHLKGLIISKQTEKKITNGLKVIGGELKQGDVVECGKAAAYLEWSGENTQRG